MSSQPVSATHFSALKSKIEQRQARVAIIGLGYVGLPLALLYAESGFSVTGFDIDERKVSTLNAGGSYIFRITEPEIQRARSQGFVATSQYSQLETMDAIIICVPTPLNEYHEPDLSYITGTTESIAPHLQAGQLVILESTTYPGTTEEVMVPILEKGNRHGLKAARGGDSDGKSFFVAFSPEREDPGNTTVARRDIPKVVGGLNPQASELAGALYGGIFNRTVQVSSPAAAEMTKLLENIYRCVNIALVNELKLLSLRMNLDIWEVIEAASTKPFGFHPFYPGPGLGRALHSGGSFLSFLEGEGVGLPHPLYRTGGRDQQQHAVPCAGIRRPRAESAQEGAERIEGAGVGSGVQEGHRRSARIAGTDHHRTAAEGRREVSYNDPYFPEVGRGRKYDLQMKCAPLDNLAQYDCVLIVTDHSDYDYERIVRESRLVVDTRNATRGIKSTKIVPC